MKIKGIEAGVGKSRETVIATQIKLLRDGRVHNRHVTVFGIVTRRKRDNQRTRGIDHSDS